jgi:hypothetical protein
MVDTFTKMISFENNEFFCRGFSSMREVDGKSDYSFSWPYARKILFQNDPQWCDLEGVPKGLLPAAGGRRILDYWWEAIKT